MEVAYTLLRCSQVAAFVLVDPVGSPGHDHTSHQEIEPLVGDRRHWHGFKSKEARAMTCGPEKSRLNVHLMPMFRFCICCLLFDMVVCMILMPMAYDMFNACFAHDVCFLSWPLGTLAVICGVAANTLKLPTTRSLQEAGKQVAPAPRTTARLPHGPTLERERGVEAVGCRKQNIYVLGMS